MQSIGNIKTVPKFSLHLLLLLKKARKETFTRELCSQLDISRQFQNTLGITVLRVGFEMPNIDIRYDSMWCYYTSFLVSFLFTA